ncbi:hypothetical protein HANVADRAFT_51929 [Hanseniaspora valbyensis NRRL Y-1626]|uniref:Uncharacterized protein n=1 Tax=Hanseniaspora valbyensis NRRL Y-1626 TaxID=766949 RepID=A0A1B7TGE1_9ASCO|nr:hypothetical protein HANVADRAFT_51929 [Hanseniaspora valbyensis NRRL Y-1626]
MSTESIVSEIKKRTNSQGVVENDGKSLLYITKINIQNEDNIDIKENEKLFNTLLKNDIIDQPIYNTQSLTKKLDQLRNSWIELNLFKEDDIKFKVDLNSNTQQYDNQIKQVVETSFVEAQEDYLHQREIFYSNKPIPVELNVYSKLNNFDSGKLKLSANASEKTPFTYQLSYLGKALTIQNNSVLNYSLHLKTSALKNSYSPTFQFNLDNKFINQPNSKMYLQSNFGLLEKQSYLKDVKFGLFKQLSQCCSLDLSFKTNFNKQLNILFNYQQNLDKSNKFVFNLDHDILSLKNNWNINILSKHNIFKSMSSDNKLTFNDEKVSNNLTWVFGDSFFTAASLATNYNINSSELNTDLILKAGINASKRGPFLEFGFKQPTNESFNTENSFFYNIAWQY